ncbi:MAG: cadherin-like beta sandwich domain-containing protein, partial [Butyricicoccus sp.]
TPTAMSSNATVTVNGMTLTGGKASVTLYNSYKPVQITVTAPDGKTTQTYRLTVRTEVSPSNPYKTLYPGEHVEEVTLSDGSTPTFTVYVPDGARESTAGIFVLPDEDEDVFETWKTLADNTDTDAIDADWETQQEKFIVVYLDGLTYDDPETDIEYVNQVYNKACGRTTYCIHEAKNYMVGYGKGGTIAQMAAMDQTAVWAGLATVGAGAVDADWIAENGAEMASSLNGFNDQSNSTRKSTTPKHTLPLPVWMIGEEADEATLAYWKSANKIDGEGTTEDGITKYVRTMDWQKNEEEDETIYGMNRDKDAYRVWVSDKPEGDLEATIWTDFLYGVRRWMADPGGDLRMTLDPIRDQGMTRHYEEVGGWMREWYVYVPEGIGANAPVIFANHGYTLNGAVYSGQTDWPKVAEQEKFIVIFPSAISGNISDSGNAPWPAWNISLDPTRMDEIEFFKYMLEDVAKDYSIDRGRVYATGHSWGSQMTHMLAANEPEMFAAVAPLSGFVFNGAIFDQLAAAKAEEDFAGVFLPDHLGEVG